MKWVMAVLSLCLSLFVADRIAQAVLCVPSNYLSQIVRIDSASRPAKALKPNLDRTVTGAYKEFQFRIRTDSAGFRKSIEIPVSSSAAPLIFLGDSQTVGVGVDDDRTIPSRSAERLKRRVVNTACFGYNTFEEAQALEKALSRERPTRIVLGFFAGNDPYENSRYNEAGESGGASSRPVGILGRIKDYLVARSFFYQALMGLRKYDALNDFLYRIKAVQTEPPKELAVFRKSEDSEAGRFWEKTEEAFLLVKDLSDRSGVPVTVLFLPDRYQVDEAYWSAWVKKYRLDGASYDLDAPNKRVATLAKKHALDLCDATDALRRTARAGDRVYWRIDNHLNARGNEVIADLLAEHLKDKLA